MFGCLRNIGCLVLLIVIAAFAWMYRDRWWPGERTVGGADRASEITWEPLSDSGADRAREAVTSLGKKSGPVFANIKAADLISYIYISLSKRLPPSADEIEATVIDDRVHVRATVALDDLKSADALGPFASFLTARERLELGGSFHIVEPGLAEFIVEEFKVRDFAIPSKAIPKLLRQIERGERPEGVAGNAIPIPVPKYIADVRVVKNHVTLYKTLP